MSSRHLAQQIANVPRPNPGPAFLLGLFLVLAPSGARALERTPPAWGQDNGFSVHFRALSSEMSRSHPPTERLGVSIRTEGEGADLGLGYSLNPSFGLQVSAGSTVHATSQPDLDVFYSTLTLEAHVTILPEERGRPYVFAGLGAASFDVDEEYLTINTTGSVSTFGIGYLYNLSRHLVLDAALRADFIDWQDVHVDEDRADGHWVQLHSPIEDTDRATKLRVGLRWDF